MIRDFSWIARNNCNHLEVFAFAFYINIYNSLSCALMKVLTSHILKNLMIILK